MKEIFDQVYDMMTGQAPATPLLAPANEFEGGDCEALYAQAYAARVRLSQRLDGDESDESGENKDVLELVETYERMQRILCERAFAYGAQLARQDAGEAV